VKRRAHPETALALAAAQYLRLALRPPTTWFAIDHGAGRMTPAAAGLLKARGGRQGVPDLLVLHPAQAGMIGGFATVVVGLELKAKTGRPSPAQVAMAAQFKAANAGYQFCWSLEGIECALRANGIPLHATVVGSSLVTKRPGSLWPRKAADREVA
jgi:hypothetical protein